MNFLSIPKRKTGNRVCGITSVIDLGIPLGVLQSILEDYSPYIDFAKIDRYGLCNAPLTRENKFVQSLSCQTVLRRDIF